MRLMQLRPDLDAGSEGQQPHGFAAEAERHHKQSCPAVFACLGIAHHRAAAVVDLCLLSGRRGDDSRGLGLAPTAYLANEAFDALVAATEAVLSDQILPNRLGIAVAVQSPFDNLRKRSADACG